MNEQHTLRSCDFWVADKLCVAEMFLLYRHAACECQQLLYKKL